MDVEIEHGPGNSIANLQLAPGEACVAEGGAMVAMSSEVSITTTTHQKKGGGGVFKGLKRMLSGESFFVNNFRAGHSSGEVRVAATLAGDMAVAELDANEKLIIQGGSFVACEESVNIDLGWQGFKSVFAKEGVFWIHASGPGKIVFNSFGAIYSLDITSEHIVDTGHIVAFDETLNFKLSKAGKSWISSILGGEGLVCKFQGRGTVWCQSHNSTSFGRTLGPRLRPR